METEIAETFAFCPKCGEQTPAGQRGGHRFECAGCDYVLYFNQGSAVAAILCDPDGRVLFLRRQRDPGRGKLGLPGGFIDHGESAEEALVREIFEETSLKIRDWRYLASFPNRYSYRDITYLVTDLFYVCPVDDFSGITADASEVAAWFPAFPDDVLERGEAFAFVSNKRAVEKFTSRVVSKA
jgi:ADP-ribose pyrophosphatase YjhB (NUDIX family)